MKKNKVLSLILTLITVLSLFAVGCSGEKDPKTGVDADPIETTPKEDPNSIYDAEIKNLNGHEFWFLVRDITAKHLSTHEVYAAELNGDKINDAVFKRNSFLETTYNCTIHEERTDKPSTNVKEALIAGEYQYDFLFDSVYALRPLASQNLLVDLGSLENINFDKTWWDQRGRQGLAIGGKLFYAVGDAGTLDDRSTWIMIFNKGILEKNNLEAPYDLVRSGDWTVDKMVEMMTKCVEDKNGDGVYEVGTDVFAYIGEQQNNWIHVLSGGVTLSKFSSDGSITLPDTVGEDVLSAWATLKPLLTSPYRDVSDSGTRFRSGFAAFMGINAGSILNYANVTIDFGFLPFPKLNQEQKEYYSASLASHLGAYAIPATAANAPDAAANGFSSGSEQAAYFLEAFGYASVDTLTVAFYDQVIKKQMAQDEASGEMLELAFRNKIYDPVIMYNFGSLRNVFNEAGSNGKNTVGTDVNYETLVSLYESRLNEGRKALNNFMNFITEG